MPFAVFRADANPDIGAGHVVRCLALADALAARGWSCGFACNPEASMTVPSLGKSAHPVRQLAPGDRADPQALHRLWPGGADLLIVDYYDLGAQYESGCRPWARRLLAIDDLAARAHEADLLLDQTPGRGAEEYRSLAPAACRLLLGSEYALLRPEFAQARERAMQDRYGRMIVGRVLVSVGAADTDGVTGKVLESISGTGLELGVDVILGSGTPQLGAVEKELAASPARPVLHVDPPAESMVKLMIAADLAIGGAGVSALERCCLGLASLTLVLADNQRGNAQALQRAGAARVVILDGRSLREELAALCRAPAAIGEMSRAAFAVTDGLGASRVAALLDGLR